MPELDLFQMPIVLPAVIQGLTEFIPVSSSGHLLVFHAFNETGAHSRVLDIGVHVGTLLAALWVFRRDILGTLSRRESAAADTFPPANTDFSLRFIRLILVASLPVILIGLPLHIYEPGFLTDPATVAWANLIFALPLWLSDKWGRQERNLTGMNLRHAVLIGLAQALALIPGASRAGVTITAARFLGFERESAVRFSLLLSIIAIAGAGALTGFSLLTDFQASMAAPFLAAIVLSFFTGLAGIALVLNLARKFSMLPFVIYRVLLGLVLLGSIYL